jgi:hypothetical protein
MVLHVRPAATPLRARNFSSSSGKGVFQQNRPVSDRPSKREGRPSRSSLTPPCGTTAVGSSGTTHRTCARLLDETPLDMPYRVQSLVHVALRRYVDLFIPSLQWIPWPPLAGALRFSTFIGTMDS